MPKPWEDWDENTLLKAVKQHHENADCKKPLYICTGVLVAVMSSLRAVRNQLLISHNKGVISDEEFLLLYDLNKSKISTSLTTRMPVLILMS